jgi:hypothetical protein
MLGEKLLEEVSLQENAGWRQPPGAVLNRWFRKASQLRANQAPAELAQANAFSHAYRTPHGFRSVEKAIGVLGQDIKQDKEVIQCF